MKNNRIIFLCLFLITAVHPAVYATTFIVKEGGAEVGRYEEPDGKDIVEVIQNDKPKPRPEVKSEFEETTNAGSRSDPHLLGLTLSSFQASKELDPDLSAYLNRQPWMKDLRAMDKKYDLKNRLGENQGLLIQSILLLAGLGILYRVIKIILWIKRIGSRKLKKKTIDETNP